MVTSPESEFRVAFVGSYVPRHCGIATFTRDLAAATAEANQNRPPVVVAVTDTAGGGEYEYPAEVKYEIRQGVKGDYARAAEFINYSGVQLVSIQHEYGIYGGDDGAYVLELLSALRVPALVTLHTVLREPSASQKAIIRQMAKRSAGLVVMSETAAGLLDTAHGIAGDSVHIIPHGIPFLPPRPRRKLKAAFGIAEQRMILTFGLLGPNKGIETVIRALPKVLEEFPDALYFVVGATHPGVLRSHGEAYRMTLEHEAERLGVRDHVVFRDQFISPEELSNYLQAADIFVSPYLNEAQVTSGALSYAMGAGTAVVSTPYWHATELLANGRGCLFPFQDSSALAEVLSALLRSPEELERMRAKALEFTRSMVWPAIGATYVSLGHEIANKAQPAPRNVTLRTSSLPELRLDHLSRMTDDTGIIQHATYSVPNRQSGYCVDDNARALIVAVQTDRLQASQATQRLVTTYLSYLLWSQDSHGQFRNFARYDRTFETGQQSDDCVGRAVWALGVTVQQAGDEGHRTLAQEVLERALPACRELGPRGSALVILGLASLLDAVPTHTQARELLLELADKLVQRYHAEATAQWSWFEPTLTYDNAMIPLSLFTAYSITGNPMSLQVARASLEFLEAGCLTSAGLHLVGNKGWHERGGEKSVNDEQAIDAAAFVLAFRGAYLATLDRRYLQRMRQAFSWFLGGNRLGIPLYDFATAGCRDGLDATRANENQGAESTLSFLLALQGMLELAGEGSEHTDRAGPALDNSSSPGATHNTSRDGAKDQTNADTTSSDQH